MNPDLDEKFMDAATMQARARVLWDEGWMILQCVHEKYGWEGYYVFRPRGDGRDDAFLLLFEEGADRSGDPRAVYVNLPPRRVPYPGEQ